MAVSGGLRRVILCRAMTKVSFPVACAFTALTVLAACGSGGEAGGAKGPTSTSTSSKDSPLVGNPAPDFSVSRVNGTGTVKLADLKGKVVLVDFWATWCVPCKKSFPKYQELYVKYKDKIEIVGLSEDDDAQDIDAFSKTHGVKFPLGWDENKSIAGKYDPKAMPTAFVIDKAGVVRFAHKGYEDGDEAQLERELKELF